jgi:NAD(P)-dependent dehydrogenase (short-subunit alcohol dehydrogenase family)
VVRSAAVALGARGRTSWYRCPSWNRQQFPRAGTHRLRRMGERKSDRLPGEPHQIADVAAFIGANDYVNGACIDIDGGFGFKSDRRTQTGSCFS